jgi:nucleotide-binding universal stress UspA family protein
MVSVVNRKGQAMYAHILVPVSFDQDRDSKGALRAAQLLAGETGRISLLHVIEQVPSYAISYLPQGYANEARKAVEAELAEIASTLPNASAHVVEGHSGRTILDWAEAHEPDCIVIASHRPGMQDLLLGSTAAKVVRHAPCAVHVIR